MKRSMGVLVLVLGGALAWLAPVRVLAQAEATPPARTAPPVAADAKAAAPAKGGAKAAATAGVKPSQPAPEKAAPKRSAASARAAAAPPGAAPKAGAAETQPALDGSAYAVQLRDLEARIDELKEQIRRSHTRLSLLSDTILSGGLGGARAEIVLKNELSGAFRVTRALVVLDGTVQLNKQDESGALSAQQEIPIFKGSIAPGDHTVQVLVRLRGHGYGVFSYLKGYQFEVKSTHSFSVVEGKEVLLDVVAWEKGGVTTPLEQRPAVRYLERLRDLGGADGADLGPPSGGN